MPALTPDQARIVYDRIGRAQDWQRFYEGPATDQLVEHARLGGAYRVFEAGCGTGRFAALLLERHLPANATYFAVDPSTRMVALASARLADWSERAQVQRGRVPHDTGGRLADGSVDRFIANYVFDLLSDDEIPRVLIEARRLLAPAGLLCATSLTPGAAGVARLVSKAWQWVWDRWPAIVGGCRPLALADALDRSSWELLHHATVAAWGTSSEVMIAAPL